MRYMIVRLHAAYLRALTLAHAPRCPVCGCRAACPKCGIPTIHRGARRDYHRADCPECGEVMV